MPCAARAAYISNERIKNGSMDTTVKSASSTAEGVKPKQRRHRNLSNFGQATLSHSIKNKYIVRQRHQELCNDKFMPVNRHEAKRCVMTETIHDDGEPPLDDLHERSSFMIKSLHGHSVFKRSSPVS